jgi:trk system potassium uptake protein TrkH
MGAASQSVSTEKSDDEGRGVSGLLIALSILATALVIAEVGFLSPLLEDRILRFAQVAAVCACGALQMRGLVRRTGRRDYLKKHWFEFSLLALALAGVLLELFSLASGRTGHWSHASVANIVIVQFVRLASRLRGFLTPRVRRTDYGVHPAVLLASVYVSLILVGAALLMLPAAFRNPEHYYETTGHALKHLLNCLFTAVSAACCVGLTVYDVGSDLSVFGQIVVMALMQLGGATSLAFGCVLAVATMRAFARFEPDRDLTIPSTATMIRFALGVMFVFEGVGAAALFGLWPEGWAKSEKLLYSLLYSISAFCNSGFSLHEDGLSPFLGQWRLHGVLTPLMIAGGLGVIVWRNLWRTGLRRERLSAHTKIVLWATSVLIVIGGVSLLILERPKTRDVRGHDRREALRLVEQSPNRLDQMAAGRRTVAAAFLSISARTTGFQITDIESNGLSRASQFLLVLLMAVGGNPASTAGGLKTVAVAALLISAVYTLRGRRGTAPRSRPILDIFVRWSLVLLIAFAALVCSVVLALCITESDRFDDLLFESVSACSSVGLSTGLTGGLSAAGRIVLIFAMSIGRVGPVALLLILTLSHIEDERCDPDDVLVLA